MNATWPVTPGSHAVQFYESEPFLERAIAAFFTEGVRLGGPLVMIARRHLFEDVTRRFATRPDGEALNLSDRLMFVDADAAVKTIMPDGRLDQRLVESAFTDVLVRAGRMSDEGPIRVFGEGVSLLCRQGHRQAAVTLENVWNAVTIGRRPTVTVCAYAMSDFDDDAGLEPLRAICSQHTHVFPTEQIADAPDERTQLERVALLEQRARAVDRERASQLRAEPAIPLSAMPTIYVIDDDLSVRRSLARLLASVNMPAKTFDSAEAFLSEVDQSSCGCLIVDVQLLGMSGLELQRHLGDVRDRWPIIAMSGAFDMQVEQDALRLGAVTFLRKPFGARALLDAIARAH